MPIPFNVFGIQIRDTVTAITVSGIGSTANSGKSLFIGRIKNRDTVYDIQRLVVTYHRKHIPVREQQYLEVVLEEDVLFLENVVVTALGIKRKEASLTYSVEQVDGEELNRVKDPNMINTLAGKVAGVQINKAASGLGSSSKVLMRGRLKRISYGYPDCLSSL